jgi:hypothetical protein
MSGVSTAIAVDRSEPRVIVTRTQDCTPILERNKALANDGDGYSPSREFRRVASVPNVVVEQWLNEGINIFDPDHWPEIRRRLNDPDNRFLRTAPGRV